MRPIRALSIGIGTFGSGLVKLMLEKGVEIVGAVDADPAKTGRDLGEVAGLGRRLGILVHGRLGEALAGARADIAVASAATFETSQPIYLACADAGLDVIATDDQLGHPWAAFPELARELDDRARARGVTVSGSGNQDALGVHLPMLISGCCSGLVSISAEVRSDLNIIGAQTSRDFHVGESVEAARASIAAKGVLRPFRHYAESIAAGLGLTATGCRSEDTPLTEAEEVLCRPLGMAIPAGRVTGMRTVTEVTTEEGIAIAADYTVKLFSPEDRAARLWRIRGEPDMVVDFTCPAVPSRTRYTQVVNRIPDVLAMRPGLVTLEAYPPLRYRHGPLVHPAAAEESPA